MSAAIRTIPKGLPRVSMARIPVVAFASSSYPSAYSSSAWAESAKQAADKLEHSAKDMASEAEQQTSGLSQHASDAIRMLESHSAIRHDKAAIHAYRDVDHRESRSAKH
ncbi:hypothetical protein BG011_008077 [Mortierella polycephala]|uniref:Uncharacterized protein n=1 Tax=Mortierella polycephala TaxID=41804 RepID=A0A9P6PRW1_9FUNG|nr:hypothetical protein BG011_008077 [Mortierella polycephala]